MKITTFIAIGASILAVGCSFRSERVEQPAPATTTQRTTTVYTDPYRQPASATTTTVTTPSR